MSNRCLRSHSWWGSESGLIHGCPTSEGSLLTLSVLSEHQDSVRGLWEVGTVSTGSSALVSLPGRGVMRSGELQSAGERLFWTFSLRCSHRFPSVVLRGGGDPRLILHGEYSDIPFSKKWYWKVWCSLKVLYWSLCMHWVFSKYTILILVAFIFSREGNFCSMLATKLQAY